MGNRRSQTDQPVKIDEEGMRSLLCKQLARKLGTLPDEIRILLNQLTLEQLDELSEALFDLENLQDLDNWFRGMSGRG